MAEALEVVLSLCDAASGAEGSCTDWKTLMLLFMGVAKIADIAADWVVVVKLLLGPWPKELTQRTMLVRTKGVCVTAARRKEMHKETCKIFILKIQI